MPTGFPFARDAESAGWLRAGARQRRVGGTILLGILAVAALAGAVVAVVDRDLVGTLILALAAVSLGLVAALGVTVARVPSQTTPSPKAGRTDRGDPGLLISYAKAPQYLLVVLLWLVDLALVMMFAVGLAARSVTTAVVALVFGIVVIWISVAFLRSVPCRLVLTPEGIYHRGLGFEHFVPWFAVYEVTATGGGETPMLVVKAHPSSQTRLRRRTWRLGTYETQFLPFLVVRAYWLGGHALYAYETVSRFFHNPVERGLLATARDSDAPTP